MEREEWRLGQVAELEKRYIHHVAQLHGERRNCHCSVQYDCGCGRDYFHCDHNNYNDHHHNNNNYYYDNDNDDNYYHHLDFDDYRYHNCFALLYGGDGDSKAAI